MELGAWGSSFPYGFNELASDAAFSAPARSLKPCGFDISHSERAVFIVVRTFYSDGTDGCVEDDLAVATST